MHTVGALCISVREGREGMGAIHVWGCCLLTLGFQQSPQAGSANHSTLQHVWGFPFAWVQASSQTGSCSDTSCAPCQMSSSLGLKPPREKAAQAGARSLSSALLTPGLTVLCCGVDLDFMRCCPATPRCQWFPQFGQPKVPSHVARVSWFYWMELGRSQGEHCGLGMIWLRVAGRSQGTLHRSLNLFGLV